MNQFFRFTSVYFTRLLFGLLLFLLPSAFLFTFFFSHPDYIKKTLRDSQAYTYVSRLVVSQATSSFAVNTENYGLSQGGKLHQINVLKQIQDPEDPYEKLLPGIEAAASR